MALLTPVYKYDRTWKMDREQDPPLTLLACVLSLTVVVTVKDVSEQEDALGRSRGLHLRARFLPLLLQLLFEQRQTRLIKVVYNL